jgi:hypothetical protein
VAGSSPKEAANHFIDPLQQSISCVTKNILTFPRIGPKLGVVYQFTLAYGRETVLKGRTPIAMTLSQQFEIVETAEADKGPFKTSTKEYAYHLYDTDRQYVWFHWHPSNGVKIPHLHLGLNPKTEEGIEVAAKFGGTLARKLHLASSRISVEQVIRFAIREFEVDRLRDDWEAVLDANQGKHEKYRSWH